MQPLSEISGYLFEHVKRMCMALCDPMLKYLYVSLAYGRERPVTFLSVLTFLSWQKSETNSCTHSYTFTHLRAHTHARAHAHNVILSFFFLSFSLSLSPTQSTIHVHFVRWNGTVSFQRFFGTLAALLNVGTFDTNIQTSKRWLDWFCSVPVFDEHLHLMRYNMAAVSKSFNLFLFCLKIKLKKPLSHRQKYNCWKSALSVYVSLSPPPRPPSLLFPSLQTHTTVVRHISSPATICVDGRQCVP